MEGESCCNRACWQPGVTKQGSTFVNSFLSEITQSRGSGPTLACAALASKTTDGVVDLDKSDIPASRRVSIAVMGSGNLGLVWFTGNDHRLTLEEMEAKNPGMVATLAKHPGVAMLMVRTASRGAVVFGREGLRYLDEDAVEGVNPTEVFGAAHRPEPPARGRDGARAGHAVHQPARPGPG